MGLRDRLASWLSPQARRDREAAEAMARGATEPIDLAPTFAARFGPGVGNQPDHRTLLQESLGVGDMATRAIADRLSSLELLVKLKRRIADGTVELETIDDHRLKLMLDRPHPNFSMAQILRLTTQYILTVGESYWLKVADGLGVPAEIDILNPANVYPQISRNVIDSYRIRDANGQEHEVPESAVIRFWFPDPENPFGSEGYLGPNAVVTDALKFQMQHIRHLYEKNAVPPAILKGDAKSTPPTDDAKKRWEKLWSQAHDSRFGSGIGLGWLPPGFDIVFSQVQTGEQLTPLLEWMMTVQLMNYRTPRSVLGQVVSGDRSSAETNQYVFDLHTVFPIATMIERTLTRSLAQLDFDPKLVIEFEEFVSRDKEFVLKSEAQDLALKVRSVNQVRSDRGLDPVDWGEEPIGTFADTPYTGDVPVEILSDFTDTSQDDTQSSDEPPRGRSWVEVGPEVFWQRAMLYERLFGAEMMMRLKQIMVKQREETIRRLRASEPRTRISIENLFRAEDWIEEFRKRIVPLYRRIIERAGSDALKAVGSTASFLFGEAAVQKVRDDAARLVTRTGKTTRKRIATQIAQALENGESVNQIEVRLHRVFEGRKRDTKRIARTEVLKAHQAAQVEGFRQSGVVERKKWNTSLDASVRDSHVGLEGVIVGLNEDFLVAGSPASSPGDSRLPPEQVINCRCFLSPVVLQAPGGGE